MGLIGKIWVRLGLDNSEYKRGIKDTERQTDQFSAGIKRMAGALLAAFSVQKIIQWGKAAINAYNEQAIAVAKLESVLKSTGNTAGLTSRELQRYAAELQRQTTFGDEATIEAMARLLTFKSISKDLFKNTIASAQDLATIMGTDLNSAVLQLGKALENPELGLTMLRRTGISFTTEQIEQVKKLLEQGKKYEAQLLILTEVQSKFGGAAKSAAETAAGAWKQVGNALGDLMEAFGSGVEKSKGFANSLKSWFEVLTDVAMSKRLNFFEKLTAFLGGNTEAFRKAREEAQQEQEYWKTIDESATAIMETIKDVAGAELMLNSIRKEGLSDRDKEVKKRLEAYIAEKKKVEVEEGAIPVLQKMLEVKNELLLVETDPNKIRIINDEIAIINKRLALLQMTTAEYKKMIEAKKRGSMADFVFPQQPTGLMGAKVISDAKAAEEGRIKAEQEAQRKFLSQFNTKPIDDAIKNQIEANKQVRQQALDQMKKDTEAAGQIAGMFDSLISNTVANSIEYLTDALAGVGDMDTKSIVAALLMPFADMAIAAGTIIATTGTAIESLKTALMTTLGTGAIAAGAALIAVGVGAKAGLKALAGGGKKASTQAANSTSFVGGAGGFNTAQSMQSPQLNLVGVLKGSDIYLSVQKETEKRVR